MGTSWISRKRRNLRKGGGGGAWSRKGGGVWPPLPTMQRNNRCQQIDMPLLNILQKFITKPQSMSINWYAFTKYTTKIYSTVTIHVNKLILPPFSPFDIKCKIPYLKWKASGNVFLGHLGGWVFHIFPRLHSIMYVCVCVSMCVWRVGDDPWYFLGFWWIILQYSIQALCNI